VFNITTLVPIDTAEAVMFCNEEEPCTIKSVVIYNEPVITCEPTKTLLPVVA
jgi:hypothetical protein